MLQMFLRFTTASLLLSLCIADKRGCRPCPWATCTPTITGVDAATFKPSAEAQTFVQSIKGPLDTTQERTLISLLTTRSDTQKQDIANEYFRITKRKLHDDIERQTFFKPKILIKALVTPLPLFYAQYLRAAMIDKDHPTMIEVFTTLSPCFILQLRETYTTLYGKPSWAHDVCFSVGKSCTNNDLIVDLLALASGERDDAVTVKTKEAETDAEMMVKALMEDRRMRNEAVLQKVFTKRSIPQLAETIKYYEKLRSGDKQFKSFEVDIENRLGVTKEIYIAMVKILKNQPLYFAQNLHLLLSKSQLSTKDEQRLIFIIRARSGIDLEDIKRAYKEEFNTSLLESIVKKESMLKNIYETLVAVVKP